MECLASFVLIVLLPLTLAAVWLSWRSRTTAREVRDELTLLRIKIETLAMGRRESAATPAPAEARSTVEAPHDVISEVAGTVTSPSAPPLPSPATDPTRDAAPATTPTAVAIAAAAAASATASAAPRLTVSTPPSLAPPARPRLSLEQRLGAQVFVWIGAIALVLAAAYLFKYSVEHGWIGPRVRVTLGALFGVSLLIGGELLRRGALRIAQALSAAGIAVLFVVVWAALHLYHLIEAPAGFALLALITATAVVLALRQGPIVATLGLVGGFVTPLLVSTGNPNAKVLFAYLTLLQAGLLAVGRKRAWWPLSGLTTLLALAWAMTWSLGPHVQGDALWVGGFLVVSCAAAVVAARGWRGETTATSRWLRGGAAVGALVVSMALLERTQFGLESWAFVGLLAAGCLALARLDAALEGLSWLAAGVVALLLADWAQQLVAGDVRAFLGVAIGATLLLAGGAWVLRRGAAHPARWAALAASAALAIDLAAWVGTTHAKVDLPWGWIELALALVWIALALVVARQRGADDAVARAVEESLAAAAALATTFVSLAVPMALDEHWIAVAWALEAAALVWLAGRIRVPLLLQLSGVLTAVVGARLLLNPEVLGYPTGTRPLLSWLLYGYGVPIAALVIAAVLARQLAHPRLGALHGSVAVALAVAFLALAVRQAFHPGNLGTSSVEIAELGALSTLWLALGCLLLFLALRRPLPELRWGGPAIVTLALGQALLGQALIANPLWQHLGVGELPVWNALLLAFGAPVALLLLAVEWERRLVGEWGPRFAPLPRLWAIAALVLLFLLVTLEVRQVFHGEFLDSGETGHAEGYSYSAAWIVLATALLLAGLLGKRRGVRLASLPVMLLAVGKVFLYDTAHLSDLYRVFSFLGLGASLLLLAWLYQRFVFRATHEPLAVEPIPATEPPA